MIAFLDHTALDALYTGGVGRLQVLEAIRKERVFATAMISKVLFAARLDDLFAGGVPTGAVEAMGRGFIEDEAAFVKIPTDPVLVEAMDFAIRYHLEADQSIQLAAALYLKDQVIRQTLSDHPVAFVTLDPALAHVALAEGLPPSIN